MDQAIRVPCDKGSRLDFSWGQGTEVQLLEVVQPQPDGVRTGEEVQKLLEEGGTEPHLSSVSWCVYSFDALILHCEHYARHMHTMSYSMLPLLVSQAG